MQIKFGLQSKNACRCYKCGRMLAEIKKVTSLAVIEILCTRGLGHGNGSCNTLNVFKIERNVNYNDVKGSSSEGKK